MDFLIIFTLNRNLYLGMPAEIKKMIEEKMTRKAPPRRIK